MKMMKIESTPEIRWISGALFSRRMRGLKDTGGRLDGPGEGGLSVSHRLRFKNSHTSR